MQQRKCCHFQHELLDYDLVGRARTQHHHRPLEVQVDPVGKVVVELEELEAVGKNGADPEVQLPEAVRVAKEDQSLNDTELAWQHAADEQRTLVRMAKVLVDDREKWEKKKRVPEEGPEPVGCR